jgi:hypothetical protein
MRDGWRGTGSGHLLHHRQLAGKRTRGRGRREGRGQVGTMRDEERREGSRIPENACGEESNAKCRQ